MSLQSLINRYQKFSQQPLRLPALVGIILGLAGVLTLGSLAMFWGSETHRYIVDVQRASENPIDDPDFPLILPAGYSQMPVEQLQPEQLDQAEAAIRAAAEGLDPEADFPPVSSGFDFVDRRSETEIN